MAKKEEIEKYTRPTSGENGVLWHVPERAKVPQGTIRDYSPKPEADFRLKLEVAPDPNDNNNYIAKFAPNAPDLNEVDNVLMQLEFELKKGTPEWLYARNLKGGGGGLELPVQQDPDWIIYDFRIMLTGDNYLYDSLEWENKLEGAETKRYATGYTWGRWGTRN